MIIARGRLLFCHIQWVKIFIVNSFILQYKYFYVLYTDINFEIMAKNSLDGWVFSLAAKLLGKWARAALEPVIKPIQQEVAHTLDDTFGHKVVKRKWRPWYRVKDVKWNIDKGEPEITWIYNPTVWAQEQRIWFNKNNHRFVEVIIEEV
jgi:hypothetical protein